MADMDALRQRFRSLAQEHAARRRKATADWQNDVVDFIDQNKPDEAADSEPFVKMIQQEMILIDELEGPPANGEVGH